MNKKVHVLSAIPPKAIYLFLLVLGIIFFVLGCSENTTESKASAKGEVAQFIANNNMLTREGVAECSTCHAMQPEIATWQLSAHNKIACTTCHAEVNIREKSQTFNSNNYNLPITLNSVIKDEVCYQCHSLKRVVTPSGDVIIPHEYHSEFGVRCTTCHDSLVHNRLDERLPKLDEKFQDYSTWTPELAEEIYHIKFSRPSMWTCLDCHKQLKATTQCAACHIRIPGLPSHEAPAWKSEHGIYGRDNLAECIHCHQMPIPAPAPEPSTGDLVADFARQTDFCYNCHQQLPENHSGKWLQAHPSTALLKGKPNCTACHDLNEPEGKSNATTTYCNKCHWFEPQVL